MSLSDRLRSRSNPNSNGHPANTIAAIDTATLNGRIRYAFGSIINSKLPDEMKGSKVAQGIRMLWPHMSKDLAKVPEDQLYRATGFIDLLMQMCIQGAPDGVPFEEYLESVMTGKQQVIVGRMRLVESNDDAAATG